MQLAGNIDRLDAEGLHGWLWDRDSETPVTVEVRVDGQALGSVLADMYRADLEAAGVGKGKHGFFWPAPAELFDGRTRRYEIGAAGEVLPGALEGVLQPSTEPGGAWNAVRSGGFDGWRLPLAHHPTARALTFADGWRLYSPEVEGDLTVRLHGLDREEGDEQGQVLGVRLHGLIRGGYVRLEAELDAGVLARGPLRLVFQTASPSGRSEVVGRVFILRRAAGEEDSVVATLLRGVELGGRAGRRVESAISPKLRAQVQASARSCLEQPAAALLLVLEFEGGRPVDAVLADVRLGGLDEPAAEGEAVALEDPHIASQLAGTRGLADWSRPERLRPSRGAVRDGGSAP